MIQSLFETELPRDRSCAAQARQWSMEAVGDEMSGQRKDDLKLVVTELIDNAFVHGQGRIRLRLERHEARIRVEVMDDGEGAAIQIREEGPELGGWGLKLVDKLALTWGAFEGTTHVWADLPADS